MLKASTYDMLLNCSSQKIVLCAHTHVHINKKKALHEIGASSSGVQHQIVTMVLNLVASGVTREKEEN